MQAFQPRPIQLPGSQPPGFGLGSDGGGNGINFAKMMRVGLIVGLVVLAIFIISVGRSYTARQRSVVQNQNIRPLGQVHTGSVQVSTPTASEIVRLPLFIQGTAELGWFSDGVFPVEIRDGKNSILASVYAIADIVDPNSKIANFRAVVEGFDKAPETRIGRVILYKQVLRDNPSTDQIASIGIDFSMLSGGAWVGTKNVDATKSEAQKTGTGFGPDGVWTKTTQTSKTQQVETKTQVKPEKYNPYKKYSEVIGGPFTCANGIDDDKDGRIDSDDPSCHSDGYPANARTYDGDLDEAKRAVTERDEFGNLPGDPTTTKESIPESGAYQNYNNSDIIWKGNAKIRVEETP